MTSNKTLRGQLVEEETVITLEELCRNCTVKTKEIIVMVEEGILDPHGERLAPAAAEWQFHVSSVKRVTVAVHLQRDLGVNLKGAALALELLDRIAELEKLQR